MGFVWLFGVKRRGRGYGVFYKIFCFIFFSLLVYIWVYFFSFCFYVLGGV